MPQDNEILKLEEAAEYLRVPLEKLIELAQHAQVPARSLGDEWRFSKTALTKWVSAFSIPFSCRQALPENPMWWEEMLILLNRTAELLTTAQGKWERLVAIQERLLEHWQEVTPQPRQTFKEFAGAFKDDPYLNKIVDEAYKRRRSAGEEAEE